MKILAFYVALAAMNAQTVFLHVDVFDGIRVLRNQTLVLDGGVVTGLGTKVAHPAGAEVIEGKGMMILPALIDSSSVQSAGWVQLVYDDGFAWGRRRPQASYEALHDEVGKVHKEHKKALVEVGSLRESMEALKAEADGLLRIFAGAQSDPVLVKLASKRQLVVIPMLAVLEGAASKTGKPRMEGALEALHLLHEAHVTMLAGGPDLPLELELLVRDLGLSPIQALQAATSSPSKVFGLTDRGTIVKGKPAKLLLVEGDPTASISVLRQAGSRAF